MPTNKYLDKNMLNKLARDNFFHNIRPGETYSIEISKKKKKNNNNNNDNQPLQFFRRKFPFG